VTSSRDELVNLLLDHGASPAQKDADGWSPLAIAGANLQWSTVHILVTRGADINELDGDGYTLLHRVCASGHSKLVQFLVSLGASHQAKDRYGRGPLDLAFEGHHYAIAEQLRMLAMASGPSEGLAGGLGASSSPYLQSQSGLFSPLGGSALGPSSILPSTSLPIGAVGTLGGSKQMGQLFSPLLSSSSSSAADSLMGPAVSAFGSSQLVGPPGLMSNPLASPSLDMFGGSPFLPTSLQGSGMADAEQSGPVGKGRMETGSSPLAFSLHPAASSLWGPPNPDPMLSSGFSDPWQMSTPFSLDTASYAFGGSDAFGFGGSKVASSAPSAQPAMMFGAAAPSGMAAFGAGLPPPLEPEEAPKELFDLLLEDPQKLVARIVSGSDPNAELDGVYLLHAAMKVSHGCCLCLLHRVFARFWWGGRFLFAHHAPSFPRSLIPFAGG
jgi:hypothetical protein